MQTCTSIVAALPLTFQETTKQTLQLLLRSAANNNSNNNKNYLQWISPKCDTKWQKTKNKVKKTACINKQTLVNKYKLGYKARCGAAIDDILVTPATLATNNNNQPLRCALSRWIETTRHNVWHFVVAVSLSCTRRVFSLLSALRSRES